MFRCAIFEHTRRSVFIYVAPCLLQVSFLVRFEESSCFACMVTNLCTRPGVASLEKLHATAQLSTRPPTTHHHAIAPSRFVFHIFRQLQPAPSTSPSHSTSVPFPSGGPNDHPSCLLLWICPPHSCRPAMSRPCLPQTSAISPSHSASPGNPCA